MSDNFTAASYEFEIYTANGQLVQGGKGNTAFENKISIAALKPGNYMLNILISGRMKNMKFTKL